MKKNFILSTIFMMPWLGHLLGRYYYSEDIFWNVVLTLFVFLLYIVTFFNVSRSSYGDVGRLDLTRALYVLLHFLIFAYLTFGMVTTILQFMYPGSLGEFRMYFFEQVSNRSLVSHIFVVLNVLVFPIILLLNLDNYKELSNRAFISLLVFNIGTNSRMGMAIALGLYLIGNIRNFSNIKIYLFVLLILIGVYILTLFRMGNGEEIGFYEIMIHYIDYLTVSSGVYLEYVRQYDFGQSYGPVTFLNTISAKLFDFKSLEGLVADVSSLVLVYTPHNTGPYNAYFTELALFPSGYLGQFFAFSMIILHGLWIATFSGRLQKRFFSISLFFSGFMPYLFTLTWFVGVASAYFIEKFTINKKQRRRHQ
jgi:hypothetical protein